MGSFNNHKARWALCSELSFPHFGAEQQPWRLDNIARSSPDTDQLQGRVRKDQCDPHQCLKIEISILHFFIKGKYGLTWSEGGEWARSAASSLICVVSEIIKWRSVGVQVCPPLVVLYEALNIGLRSHHGWCRVWGIKQVRPLLPFRQDKISCRL